jgi:hypothetical protein
MRDRFACVKMRRGTAAPVDVAVQKWKEFNLPSIKQQRFNGLNLRFLIEPNLPIALKMGVDNLRANL